MKKAIILSSGGVDSTTCVSLAVDRLGAENVVTASIFMGRSTKKRSLRHARSQRTTMYGTTNLIFLPFSSIRTAPSSRAPQKRSPTRAMRSRSPRTGEGKVSTYVPFRNGLMLSTAASLAASLFEEDEVDIYIGAHADDAAGDAYADCSEPFLKAMGDAVSIGTYGKVHLVFPFAEMNKAGVVATGLSLHTPYELTWSCYEGGEKPCGTCGTCIDRAAAFAANGVKDPALGEK